MKQICVVGVGYVGLVTAACFADLGNRVTALDVNENRSRFAPYPVAAAQRVQANMPPGVA